MGRAAWRAGNGFGATATETAGAWGLPSGEGEAEAGGGGRSGGDYPRGERHGGGAPREGQGDEEARPTEGALLVAAAIGAASGVIL